ncbi:MAG: penicillin acylase family protein [Firmicutes bacterium]|nr:penicillin acylase family protein [Bacillota bacterium]
MALLGLLEHPEQVRDQILLSSLDSAIEELEGKLSSDWSQWKWSDLHHAQLKHPLWKRLTEAERKQWNTLTGIFSVRSSMESHMVLIDIGGAQHL